MKRLIAAVSLAVLATPVLADSGKPFEQLDLDRALPNIVQSRSPFAASSGDTRSDRDIAVEAEEAETTGGSGLATGPWANDHNFIAPAL